MLKDLGKKFQKNGRPSKKEGGRARISRCGETEKKGKKGDPVDGGAWERRKDAKKTSRNVTSSLGVGWGGKTRAFSKEGEGGRKKVLKGGDRKNGDHLFPEGLCLGVLVGCFGGGVGWVGRKGLPSQLVNLRTSEV